MNGTKVMRGHADSKAIYILLILILVAVVVCYFVKPQPERLTPKVVSGDVAPEPPYFAGFRLLNDSDEPVEEVTIEVETKNPPEGWENVTGSVSPTVNPLDPHWAWVPGGNDQPEPIYGLRVSMNIGGTPRVCEITTLPGARGAQVFVVVEKMTFGNPPEEHAVPRMWVLYDVMNALGHIAYDDATTP